MAQVVELKIDQASVDKIKDSLLVLVLETELANQALAEFAAEVEKLKRQFHPIVWWIIMLLSKKEERRENGETN